MATFRVGEIQACGLTIYVFDPAFDDCLAFDGDYEPFPGTFDHAAGVLHVNEGAEEAAWSRLIDAVNSADDDGDGKVRDALTSLSSRILRSAKTL